MQTGSINVQTENIFPIIKKFLYSDHEIFLRELVSNAVDACQKLKALSSLGETKATIDKLQVEVKLDVKNKTITVSDNGIGMTSEEVEKYINQIAFSGAQEFVDQYKDKGADKGIIGHFGLGFYSAFMVSSQVEIITKSHKDGSEAVKWTCDGSTSYTLDTATKENFGTDIILHIAEDSEEFLTETRLRGILDKYCKFLPVEIKFGEKEITEKDADDKEVKKTIDDIVNDTDPTWTKTPSTLNDEDYKEFYSKLYPFTEDPLFNIHLNVDYPFNLTGILYFPKLKNTVEVQKNKIQLYCNQVFVTDSVEGIVPDFLTLLHGVIDSPDIPLNVSRSYLQSDSNVKKIANHISKKVADKLEEIFKSNREDFEAKWEDIRVFIEYGMLTDEKFFDRIKKIVLLKSAVDGKCEVLDTYFEKISANQTDKDGTRVVLYTNEPKIHHGLIDQAKERGYDVILLDGPLASHVISKLEQSFEKLSFKRVDSDSFEKLIEKDEVIPEKLNKEQQDALKPVFEGVVDKAKFTVELASLNEKDVPVRITQSEFMRRMKEQQMAGGGMHMFGNLPESYNLLVNINHPLVGKIVEAKEGDKKTAISKQLVDLALLAQGMLSGADLSTFINRSLELIKD